MRSLVIAVLVLATLAFSQQPTPQQQTKSSNATSHASTDGGNGESQSSGGQGFAECCHNAERRQNQSEGQTQAKPWWQRPTITDWIIAATTLAYAVISILLWLNSRKGIDAATKGAVAAELNARAVIDSERPWIVADIERDVKIVPDIINQAGNKMVVHFALRFRNCGKTPAFVYHYTMRSEILTATSNLPEVPDYGLDSNFGQQRLLLPRRKWPFQEWWTTQQHTFSGEASVRDGSSVLWQYGRIKYTNPTDGRDHETRFCFRYTRILDEFFIAGPAAYTQYT